MEAEIPNFHLFIYFLTAQTFSAPKLLDCKYFKFIPIIFHILITMACAHSFFNPKNLSELVRLDWLSRILTSFVLFPNILTIVSNILNGNVPNIYKMLFDLKTHIEQRFNVVFSCVEFLRDHNKKIFKLAATLVLNAICRIFIFNKYFKRTNDMAIVTMYFFSDAFVLYLLFHIDLLRYILQFMNTHLTHTLKSKHLNGVECVDMLKYIMLVHHRMWSTKNAIENRFGWILLSMFFKSFIHIINNVYWYFQLAIIHGSAAVITMRKYSYFIFSI